MRRRLLGLLLLLGVLLCGCSRIPSWMVPLDETRVCTLDYNDGVTDRGQFACTEFGICYLDGGTIWMLDHTRTAASLLGPPEAEPLGIYSDGKLLYFLEDGEPPVLYRLDPANPVKEALFDLAPLSQTLRSFTWQAADDRFAVQDPDTGRIWTAALEPGAELTCVRTQFTDTDVPLSLLRVTTNWLIFTTRGEDDRETLWAWDYESPRAQRLLELDRRGDLVSLTAETYTATRSGQKHTDLYLGLRSQGFRGISLDGSFYPWTELRGVELSDGTLHCDEAYYYYIPAEGNDLGMRGLYIYSLYEDEERLLGHLDFPAGTRLSLACWTDRDVYFYDPADPARRPVYCIERGAVEDGTLAWIQVGS